jgi:hypothetical protein
MSASLILVPFVALSIVLHSYKKVGFQITEPLLIDLWVLFVASVLAAFGVWRVRPWGFFLFFAFVTGVVVTDLHHIINNPKTVNYWDFVDAFLVVAGTIFILQRHVSAPYFNPKIRWWERPERHKVSLKAVLLVGGKPMGCQILDISQSGCFMDTEAYLSIGDIAAIDLVFQEFKFECPVQVIRHSHKPKGVGLMFIECTIENQREIRRIIKTLKRNLKTKIASQSASA